MKKRKAAVVDDHVMDFSGWALQDTIRSPVPSTSSGSKPILWLGVQSLANIATGRDGKVVVCNAVKKGVTFELGYVEGHRQQTHIVMPMDAPGAVAKLFSTEVAKKVLKNPSFLARLEEAGGWNVALDATIDRILAELNVLTPPESEAMKAFCATCGSTENKLPIRVSRVNGELVMALVDVVMLAKKCTYDAARHICQRLLLDHWNYDMDAKGMSQIFHSIRLQGGSNGGQATICVGAACVAEVLILIPGCELSVKLRRDMIQSFFGVSGNEVTFESLLSNHRIQAHLKTIDNPVGDFMRGQVLGTYIPSCVVYSKKSSLDRTPRETRSHRLALSETLDWKDDLGVSLRDLPGVKAQFKALLHIEVSSGEITSKYSIESWARSPPLILRDVAKRAVDSYRNLVERRSGTAASPDDEEPEIKLERCTAGEGSDENDDQETDESDDILRISEIMSVAGVWKAVWSIYRSDLANQMLALKCSATAAEFSDKRPESVRGGVHVLVHQYKKSCDWPLAWKALQNTKDLYEKRIREFLEEMFLLAGRRGEEQMIVGLARDIASSLIVDEASAA